MHIGGCWFKEPRSWVCGTYVAREIVAGTLAVELAEAIADVTAWLVVGRELLGSETSGAGIAHVDTRHHAGNSSRKDLQKVMQSDSASVFRLSPAPRHMFYFRKQKLSS